MSRRRFPRYQGSDPDTLAELHDQAMDELVRQYRAHADSLSPERNANEINSTSPVLPTPKGIER